MEEKKIMKNISMATAVRLEDLVTYQDGQVVSKTLVQNEHVSMTIFAFDKNEEISSHSSKGDAMVQILDGTGKLTIDGVESILQAGETIVMPANKPHAVYGEEQFKMLLTVIF